MSESETNTPIESETNTPIEIPYYEKETSETALKKINPMKMKLGNLIMLNVGELFALLNFLFMF